MTILVAPDKFKGSLTAEQVCEAVREGLLQQNPELKIVSIPMADGGEGTCELLTNFFNGKKIDDLFDLALDALGFGSRQVDLVDHRKHLH